MCCMTASINKTVAGSDWYCCSLYAPPRKSNDLFSARSIRLPLCHLAVGESVSPALEMQQVTLETSPKGE
eukprot:m.138850 g.138850  ORF g.138850 m.138850 type:complete len:70 (+) comp14014_c0_seq8:2817-3026(+)